MPGVRELAHHRDFTLLWVAQTVSELGNRVSLFVFPLLGYALTGSTVLAGVISAVNLFGVAVVLLPAGVLADRVDRRRLMRAASAAGVLLYGSLVAAIAGHALTTAHLVGVALGTGLVAGILAPAEVSAVRTVVPAALLPTALAQTEARQHVASLAGGPLGGALFTAARWLPFAADLLSYAACWVLLGRIRTDLSAPARDAPAPRAHHEIADGARFVLTRPFFRAMLLWSPLVNLTVNATLFIAVLRLIQAGTNPVHIGLVETAAGVSGILGALAAPRLITTIPTGTLTVLVAWSWVPLMVPLALFNTPLTAALCLSAGIFLNPAGNSGIYAYRIHLTPPELNGRVHATMQFAAYSTMPLFPLIAGGLLAVAGGPTAVSILIAATAAVALIPTLSHHVRSVPRPTNWPPPAS